MKNILKKTGIKGMFIPLCFSLILTFNCKKESSDPVPDVNTSSSITIQFKGKTFVIPYIKPQGGFPSIEGDTYSRNENLGSTQQPVSSVGVAGFSNELIIDIGGNRRGEPIGVYKFEKYTQDSNTFYFGVYLQANASISYLGGSMLNQNTYTDDFQFGTFTDLTDGSKDWEIIHKTSTIAVTKSDAKKLEGSFSLDLKYANLTQKATGVFDIYK
ncbi:hypothetical protein [Daejeonella oryzae]|uniref:hypothetical protein n=1 Tax=Daejeonella oryzae TaxID=1122943 RepID=UPI0003F507FE|nr:hypothetical protein [Daejeonella oryzae]